jgi:hypothetical protein
LFFPTTGEEGEKISEGGRMFFRSKGLEGIVRGKRGDFEKTV